MRKWILALFLLILAGCSPSLVNQHTPYGTGHDDSNTINTIPTNNASFFANLSTFLQKEEPNRAVEWGYGNFVSTNANANACLGVTGAGLTMNPTQCIAYNAGYRSLETNAITFSNNATTWVAMDENTSGNNAGLPNFTRYNNTHYLLDTIDASQPTMASDSQLLMKVVTSGGSITGVTDLRTTGQSVKGNVVSSSIQPQNNNCTDHIGAFNGSRSGEINLADCGAVGPNSWSLETTTCTSNGTATLSCPNLAVTHFAVGQNVAFYKGAGSIATTTPSLTVTPITANNSASLVDGVYSSLSSGCTVFNPVGWGNSGQNVLSLSNQMGYEKNNTITIEGNNYTISSIPVNGTVILNTNLLTTVSGRFVTDAVTTASSTTLTSASASFTSANDVGRPVRGVGIQTGTTIQSVTNGTTIVLSLAATLSNTGLTVAFGSEPITGGNCSTSRSYEAFFVYPNGAHGPMSTCVTNTTTANALNWYNYDQIQTAWDTNAIAIVYRGQEGNSCTNAPIIGGDVPTWVYNPQTHTGGNAYLNDSLLMTSVIGSGLKQAPLVSTFHDIGQPYGYEFLEGLLPLGSRNGIYTGVINSISGTNITLNSTVPQSVTSTLVHNDAPIIASALSTALTSSPNGPIYTGIYAPAGRYPVVSTTGSAIAPALGTGFHLYGDGGRGESGIRGATEFVNYGAFGTIGVNLLNLHYPELDHITLASGAVAGLSGASTWGVGIDMDQTTHSGPSATHPTLHDLNTESTVVGLRLGNTDTLANVEFGDIKNVQFGASNDNANNITGFTPGSYGVQIPSDGALKTEFINDMVTGDLGFQSRSGLNAQNVELQGVNMMYAVVSPYMENGTISIKGGRQEFLTRVIYSPSLGGGVNGEHVDIEDNIFYLMQYTPDCGVVQISGGGPATLIGNDFQSLVNSFNNVPPDTCQNGIVTYLDTGTYFALNSFGNIWDNQPHPFFNLNALNNSISINSQGDRYRAFQNANQLTALMPSDIAPTQATLVAPCPFNILARQANSVSTQSTTCSVASNGTVAFPYQSSNLDFYGVLTLTTGQDWCSYDLFISANSSTGVITFDRGINTAGAACTTTQNNAGTINVYFASNALTIQNKTAGTLNIDPTVHGGGE